MVVELTESMDCVRGAEKETDESEVFLLHYNTSNLEYERLWCALPKR